MRGEEIKKALSVPERQSHVIPGTSHMALSFSTSALRWAALRQGCIVGTMTLRPRLKLSWG